ncbi:uncharacterized protein LOC123397981 [Hordeum vulgare subsp. vulgare]|uniref:uncharacterized protein LOC123397981 n=1 Tax=Hordeum vulgare subsp. vulgare TaxID=112509 RepID=UPI00162C3B10|nr:uncharacterized protein LOC123397981 [Hordeum vulgare subsp. vulgare]
MSPSVVCRMTQETDAHLCRLHLRQLVARGLWSNALNYLRRFFDPDASCTLDLVWFLNAFWVLDNMAAKHGAMRTGAAVYYHDVSLSTYLSRNAKLSSIINTIANSQQFRLSLDWQLVRRRASFVVYQLLLESPELRRLLILPRETLNPQQLLPIGPRRPRRHVRKQARRPTATAMARLYLNTKRSLFSSESPHPALLAESLKRVADLIDQCLKDGKRPEPHKGRLLQSICMEGTPVSQPTQNFGISSATNAGAPSAPFLKNNRGTLTNPATNIGT